MWYCRGMKKKELKKDVHVPVPENLHKALQEMAEYFGKTIIETVKAAIRLEKKVYDVMKEGGRVFVESKEGGKMELFLR